MKRKYCCYEFHLIEKTKVILDLKYAVNTVAINSFTFIEKIINRSEIRLYLLLDQEVSSRISQLVVYPKNLT